MAARKVLGGKKKNYLRVSDLFTSTITCTYQFILQQAMMSTVRKAEDDDFDAVFRIYFEKENNVFLHYNPMKKDDFRKIWKMKVSRKHSYVCEMLGSVIGFISASCKEGRSRHVAHITPIVVRKEFKGFGIGKKLMRHVLRELREDRIERVDLEVNADNKKAIKFFRRFGFEKEAVIRKNVKKGSRYYDDYIMAKFF